jgi:hypothetical protein
LSKVNLKDLVRAEIARREEASSTFLPFCYTVCDRADALTDIREAVRLIEAEHAVRSRPYRPGEESEPCKGAPVIASSIQDAVEAALAAAHPRQFARPGIGILSHSIVESVRRHAPVPEMTEGAGPATVAGRIEL